MLLGVWLAADALVAGPTPRASSVTSRVPRNPPAVLQFNPFGKTDVEPDKGKRAVKKVKRVTKVSRFSFGSALVKADDERSLPDLTSYTGLAFLASVPAAAAAVLGGVVLFANGNIPEQTPFDFLYAGPSEQTERAVCRSPY